MFDAPEGAGNDALNKAAGRMGQLVGGGQLLATTVEARLMGAATIGGRRPHEESRATIRSGLAWGILKPRYPKARLDGAIAGLSGDVWWDNATTDDPDATDPAAAIRGKIITTDDLAMLPPPRPLIDGYLYRNTLAWIAAAPGSYKTIMSIHLAGCIANGIPCVLPNGSAVAAKGGVLYVSGEGASGLYKRVAAWTNVYGGGVEPAIEWLPEAVQVTTGAWQELCAYAAETKPALIVLDTQSRMTVGLDENDAKSATQVVARLDQLRRESGACVLTNHHASKSGATMRGSSVIEGAADTVIALDRPDEDDPRVIVRCSKQKDAAPFRKFVMEPRTTIGSIVLVKATNDQFDSKPKTYRGRQ